MLNLSSLTLFHIPQKGWKQKQETEIEKMFPIFGPNSHPFLFLFLENICCFLFLGHIIETETETVFKGRGWLFQKILGQDLFLSVSISNSYEVFI